MDLTSWQVGEVRKRPNWPSLCYWMSACLKKKFYDILWDLLGEYPLYSENYHFIWQSYLRLQVVSLLISLGISYEMCAYTKFVQNHHLKMSCRWKSFKLSCMEKKISQKKRFYFCRVIGRSIKTWLIFTITCSTWLAVCWEMLRGINSGERDKVESLIDSQS